VITVESVTKRYGDHTAVNDVTFTAQPGRVTVFLGPNGAVAYMVYALIAPGLLTFLAFNQAWFRDARGGVDPKYNQDMQLRAGDLSGEELAQLATTTVIWLVLPPPSPLSTCFARR
jgi:hypothetical protein